MPHYFFHLHDGDARLEDASGVCLPDAEAAWYQAYRSARDLLARDGQDRGRWASQCLRVEEAGGLPVWTVPLTDIAELTS
jgi:hypothetical protein